MYRLLTTASPVECEMKIWYDALNREVRVKGAKKATAKAKRDTTFSYDGIQSVKFKITEEEMILELNKAKSQLEGLLIKAGMTEQDAKTKTENITVENFKSKSKFLKFESIKIDVAGGMLALGKYGYQWTEDAGGNPCVNLMVFVKVVNFTIQKAPQDKFWEVFGYLPTVDPEIMAGLELHLKQAIMKTLKENGVEKLSSGGQNKALGGIKPDKALEDQGIKPDAGIKP